MNSFVLNLKSFTLFLTLVSMLCSGESKFNSTAEAKSTICSPGWTHFNNKCYYIATGDKSTWKTWAQADAICKAYSANLLKIESSAENDFIISFYKPTPLTPTWLGAQNVGGGIRWQDGTPLTYSNWYYNQPDGRPGGEECVEFIPKGAYTHNEWKGHAAGVWNDYYCSSPRGIICQKSINKCFCHYGSGNYCGSRKSIGMLQGDCDPKHLFYCPGSNGLPASSKGNCAGFCLETSPGLDACPSRVPT